MSYECFACGTERPVVIITTSLETGFTTASCREDLPISLVGALAVELGVDASKLYASVERFVDREQKSAAKAAAAAAVSAASSASSASSEYEDGNTDYGREQAEELNGQLAAEHKDQAVAQ